MLLLALLKPSAHGVSLLYLDHAASTPMVPAAKEMLNQLLEEEFANPAAKHRLATQLMERIDFAREDFLKWSSANRNFQFIFTGSATESNNMIIQGLGITSGKIHVSSGDHPSNVKPIEYITSMSEAQTKEISLLVNGKIDDVKLIESLDKDSRLIAISYVNNHSGTIQDIVSLSQSIRKAAPQIHIHIDGVQSFSKFPLKLDQSPIDSYTISSHKMGGPKGVAGLYLKKSVKIRPLLWGGSQELNLRASTVSAPLVLSWHRATEIQFKDAAENHAKMIAINMELRKRLSESIKDLKILFPAADTSPTILTIATPKVPSDMILRHLEEFNIFASSSSACSAKGDTNSPVFSALNIPKSLHKNVLRISIGATTQLKEIPFFVEKLKSIYEDLKNLKGGR